MSVLRSPPTPRRAALRGLLGGSAVAVGLPFLDLFLNANGTALATTGRPIPLRFGTWFWGMGLTPGLGVAERTTTGRGIAFLEETAALKPFQAKLNYFSDFGIPLDGTANVPHHTGWVASRTGAVPAHANDLPEPTLDRLIADANCQETRFKTIDVSSVGIARENYSSCGKDQRNNAEVAPLDLYARLFLQGQTGTTSAPRLQETLKRSVLSAVTEPFHAFRKTLGTADRMKLEAYFNDIRELEAKLVCINVTSFSSPDGADPAALTVSWTEPREIMPVVHMHAVMGKMLAIAAATHQSNVINMVFTDAFGSVTKTGERYTHHALVHHPKRGRDAPYDSTASWFNKQAMINLAAYLQTLDGISEGDGTLLDNCLIFATSDTGDARTHALADIPVFLAGKAAGRVRTGLHVVGKGSPISRIGLTIIQAMGSTKKSWGTKSLSANQPITELFI